MLDNFRKFIENEQLIAKETIVLLGVSGGVDSMVMADLFIRAGIQIGIAHCNFQLRDKESDIDEAFVKKFAQQHKINCYTKRFDTLTFARKKKISIQMAARELRMEWFEKILGETDYSAFAMAHHLDDQSETFFINLMRITGIAGLHGILPRQGKLIHPMLFSTRKEILQYAASRNIPFRSDSSNQKTDYLRNKIRHTVLPKIEEISPGFAQVLSKSISNIKATEDIYRDHLQEIGSKLHEDVENGIRINIQKLMNYKHAATYLYEFLSPYGFNTSTSNQVYKSLIGTSGKKFESNSHSLLIDRDFIIIKSNKSFLARDEYPIEEDTASLNEPLRLKIKHLERTDSFQISRSKNIGQFDEATLQYPLTMRKWREGDVFYPLGMKNRKKISDFFVDQKFSLFEKKDCWLLLSAAQIIWIMGHRIDDRVKITPNTKHILEIRIVPSSEDQN